ncbi:carbonic anhydrase [Aromatoleum diolicum]|uniref:Twin-arginine translocation signal domain-containing protein n=1 Tax=Aromatoleum diolicum TaxID=75796 RepID=A0ABX1Q924_9RHOO|nr:carbonic anhydrase [Aromatoleum diolicum]NMG74873.1 twin-arginine translocation signal domain-containing protein [Aromatoleum diolicum]
MNPRHPCACHHDQANTLPTSRRNFLQRATLATGVALLGTVAHSGKASAGGHTDILLLTCMDFRLMDSVEHYMAARGLTHKYDHVVLAGASLGAVTDKYPAWNRTFWDHLGVAIQLHDIHKVVVMDHRDCGAYKAILGEDLANDPVREQEIHRDHLDRLALAIKTRHPGLEVETLLMALDGSVETLGTFA